MVLEIPKNFDVNNREAIRRLIEEEATSESEGLKIDTSVRGEARRLPSPGMSAASIPRGFPSPSSYASGSSRSGLKPSRHSRSHFSSSSTSQAQSPNRRAPSPGISTAKMPLNCDSSYNRSNNTPRGRPRITPETPVGRNHTRKPSLPSYLPGNPNRSQMAPQGRRMSAPSPDPDREAHMRVDWTDKPFARNPIIDVETVRKKADWREGRDDVIIVDSPSHCVEREESVNSASLDALLARIEKTKSQLEEKPDPSEAPGSEQYRLRSLIDNLTKAANEMDQIEIETFYYSDR